MPTADERQGADYFHIMFLLANWNPLVKYPNRKTDPNREPWVETACFPQVLLPLVFHYAFAFFDFFEILPRAVINRPPREGDPVQYGDEIVVMHSRATYNVFEGMTGQIVSLTEAWIDPRDIYARVSDDHDVQIYIAFALKYLQRPEDRTDVKMSCMYPVVNQVNPADVWLFFTSFRSRAILITMLLTRSEDYLGRALRLIDACPCSEEERRQLFYIAYLKFKKFTRWEGGFEKKLNFKNHRGMPAQFQIFEAETEPKRSRLS